MEEKAFFVIEGKEYCNETYCLSVLLKDCILFCNEWTQVDADDKTAETSTVLFVLCNDLFYWGTADAECLPNSEIGNLYRMHIADPTWGRDKWCCFRRNLQPQVPIVKAMKKDGVWDEKLEALPKPCPS